MVLLFSLFFLHKIQKTEQYNTNMYKLKTVYLKINKTTERLLISQIYPANFYSSEIAIYAADFFVLINEFNENMKIIEADDRTEQFKTNNEILKIYENIDNYKTKLTEILLLKQKIGNLNNGIIKNIMLAKKEIIVITQDIAFEKPLKDKILELFIIQENFENSVFTNNLDNFNKIYQEVYNHIISSDANNLYQKYLYTKTLDYLSEFRSAFNLLVEKKIEIGLSETEGHLGKLKDIKNFSETNIDDLIESVNNQSSFHIFKLFISYIIVALIIIVIFFIVIYKISKYYDNNITSIKEKIDKLAAGEIIDNEDINTSQEFENIYEKLYKISETIERKNEFTKNIINGDFKSKLITAGNNDVLGNSLIELNNNLNLKEENAYNLKNADDILDWKTHGLAKFGEVMRRNTENLQNLSKEVIRNLIEYVNAVQGGFYIYNNENQNNVFLELTAYYAFGKEKIANQQINLHEGLIGTCAVERNKFYFEEIPDNYIYMTSGFGQAKPKSLIILPLTIDKIVYGVIELSSLNPLKDYEIDFLEKLAEDIAITVSYVKINDETARFLKMSERQTRKLLRKQHELLEQIKAEEEKYEVLNKKILKKEQIVMIKDELINEKTREILRLNKIIRERDTEIEKIKEDFRNLQFTGDDFFNKVKKERNELKNKISILESEISKIKDIDKQ